MNISFNFTLSFLRHAVLAMNFTSEQMKPLHNTSLFKLKDLVLSNADKSIETAKEQEGGDGPPAKVPKLDPELKEQVQIENQTTETVKLEFGVLDGLIVACRRPGNISRELLKLLKPSGNFVLYCPYIEVNISLNFEKKNHTKFVFILL